MWNKILKAMSTNVTRKKSRCSRAVLRVEHLEVRSVLSASMGWTPDGYEVHWEEAPDSASASKSWDQQELVATWREERDLPRAAPDVSRDGLSLPYETWEASAQFDEWNRPKPYAETLDVRSFESSVANHGMQPAPFSLRRPNEPLNAVLMVSVERPSQSALSYFRMPESGVGPKSAGTTTDSRRLAAASPSVDGRAPALPTIRAPESPTDPSIVNIEGPFVRLDAATAESTGQHDGSRLLRALETRDTVFQALAGTVSARRDIATPKTPGRLVAVADADRPEYTEEAYGLDGEFDTGTSLRETTDRQSHRLAQILKELNAPAAKAARRRATDAPPTDRGQLPEQPPGEGNSSPLHVETTEDQGGMIVIRATGAITPGIAVPDKEVVAFDEVFGIDADVGSYRAFGVATQAVDAATDGNDGEADAQATRDPDQDSANLPAVDALSSVGVLAGAAVGILFIRPAESRRRHGVDSRK